MRIAIALALFASASLLARPASAVPLALGDQAAVAREAASAAVETASRRAQVRRHYKSYAYAGRRYNWSYYPYWRPYRYRYWQFYYPYGGPLF